MIDRRQRRRHKSQSAMLTMYSHSDSIEKCCLLTQVNSNELSRFFVLLFSRRKKSTVLCHRRWQRQLPVRKLFNDLSSDSWRRSKNDNCGFCAEHDDDDDEVSVARRKRRKEIKRKISLNGISSLWWFDKRKSAKTQHEDNKKIVCRWLDFFFFCCHRLSRRAVSSIVRSHCKFDLDLRARFLRHLLHLFQQTKKKIIAKKEEQMKIIELRPRVYRDKYTQKKRCRVQRNATPFRLRKL